MLKSICSHATVGIVGAVTIMSAPCGSSAATSDIFLADQACADSSNNVTLTEDQQRVAYGRSIGYLEGELVRVKTGEVFPERAVLGTATLIDQRGHFLTAAHVVQVPDIATLRLKGFDKEYKVRLLKSGVPGDTPESVANDWALIEAVNWKNDGTVLPVPLRCSGSITSSGWFGAATRLGKGEIGYYTFLPADFSNDGTGVLRGNTFKGMSGALLVDKTGRGFGIVGANREPKFEPRTNDEEREWMAEKAVFGMARIEAGAPWWEYIEPADEFKNVLDLLKSPGDYQRGLRMLQLRGDPELVDVASLVKECAEINFKGWSMPDVDAMLSYVVQKGLARCLSVTTFASCYRNQSLDLDVLKHVGMRNAGRASTATAVADKGRTQELAAARVLLSSAADAFIARGGDRAEAGSLYAEVGRIDLQALSEEQALTENKTGAWSLDKSVRSIEQLHRLRSNIAETIATIRQLDPNNVVVYDLAKQSLVAAEDWVGAAGAVAEKARIENIDGALSSRTIRTNEAELKKFSTQDAEAGGNWGKNAKPFDLQALAKGSGGALLPVQPGLDVLVNRLQIQNTVASEFVKQRGGT